MSSDCVCVCVWDREGERERHLHTRARGPGEQPEQHMFNISPIIITSHSLLIMERLQDGHENRHAKKYTNTKAQTKYMEKNRLQT